MVDKIRTLQQAVTEFVPNGAQVAFGGFTMQRHPMAFVPELIRLLHEAIDPEGSFLPHP